MTDTEYVTAGDLDDVLGVLAKLKDRARLVAGGTNVIPDMRRGSAYPELIINLSDLKGLDHIREEAGTISIGALTTISDLASSEVIRDNGPILSSAAGQLGNPLTRNRATIGGNLGDASPAADMAPPLLALDASVHIERAVRQKRQMPVDQFFLGPNETRLERDEIITKITFPKPGHPENGAHIKLGLRNAMAISVASIAVMLDMDGKVCRKARVALGSVAPKPIRAYTVETRLEGKQIDQALIEECARLVKGDISPISDIRATAEYRTWVTSVLVKRAIHAAMKGRKNEDLSG
jgi:carbon-monoxide dehydrogenase medium subunit